MTLVLRLIVAAAAVLLGHIAPAMAQGSLGLCARNVNYIGCYPDADSRLSMDNTIPIAMGDVTARLGLRRLADLLLNTLEPDWYRSPTDGADDAPSIQAAINAACAIGNHTIQFRARQYTLESPIVQPCALTWEGQGWTVPNGATAMLKKGTWLTISGTSFTPITVTGPEAAGSRFERLGVNQIQPTPGPGWTPTIYPCVFNVINTYGQVGFDNVLLAPVYDGICTNNSGRLEIGRLYGQPLHQGINIQTSFDATHILFVHFWNFWSGDPNVMAWQQANGDTLVLGRTDGLTAPDYFAYGYRSAVRLISSPATGSANRLSFGKLYADATTWGVWIQSGNDAFAQHASLHINSYTSDGESVAVGASSGTPVVGSTPILIDTGARADVTIDHIDTQFHADAIVTINSTLPFSTVRLGPVYANYYNFFNHGAALVQATASSNPAFPHDVSLSALPVVFPSYPAPLINQGTFTSFDWPGYARSAQEFTTVANNQVFAMQDYTAGLRLQPLNQNTYTGLTWQLPPHPRDGQTVWFSCSQPISGLTVGVPSSSAPYPIDGQPPGTLPGHTRVSYRFSGPLQNWELIGS